MKCFFILLVVAVVYCNANRAKRLAALRVASINGGDIFGLGKLGHSKGCIVTGKKLYINGIYTRELTDSELQEVEGYQVEAAEYKKLLHAAFMKQAESLDDITSFLTGSIAKVKYPDPPKKPSFCTEEITKQISLDGCVVQDNKIYIGTEYARDLTADEIEQLTEYEKKLKVYEAAATEQLKERLKSFNFSASRMLAQLESPSSPTPLRRSSPAPTTETLVAPVAPNFCTTIY